MTQVGINEVNKIKNLINETDSDILLVGKRGYGKTTILKEVAKYSDREKMLVNGTVKLGEEIFLVDRDVYNLYHICLIIKKILLNIRTKYIPEYMNCFVEFEIQMDNILRQIGYMNMTGIHRRVTKLITEDLYSRPEILLDEILRLISKYLNIKDLTLIVDNFDEVDYSSKRYQEFLYNRIKEYINLILTISDERVIDNNSLLEDFSEDNEVIKLDYSTSLDSVKEILEQEVHEILSRDKVFVLNHQLKYVLSDETILLMIEKTNGNLFDMLNALRTLYHHIDELDVIECNAYILNYIDKVINMNPIISGHIIPKRTLHVKPKTTK